MSAPDDQPGGETLTCSTESIEASIQNRIMWKGLVLSAGMDEDPLENPLDQVLLKRILQRDQPIRMLTANRNRTAFYANAFDVQFASASNMNIVGNPRHSTREAANFRDARSATLRRTKDG